MDGLSQPNFHTYTVGFGLLERDGGTYLAGNLTTSVLIGGKRAHNVTINPLTRRGSTFVLGPITGDETAKDVEIQYLAGGFRTPNGFNIGPDGEIIVADNQGVFNPSTRLLLWAFPAAAQGHQHLRVSAGRSRFGGRRFPLSVAAHRALAAGQGGSLANPANHSQ